MTHLVCVMVEYFTLARIYYVCFVAKKEIHAIA
jgi:hypothetical protein